MDDQISDEKFYPKAIVVVGAGVVGWTVAAALANGLNGLDIKITVLDDGNYIDQFTPCDSATPAFSIFNKILGIDERNFIKQTGSAYLLATCYKNLFENDDYFMPFSEHGFMMNGLSFSSYASCLHAKGDNTSYDFYSLSATAARLGRFRHPAGNANSLFSTIEYGFQVNTKEVSDYWRRYAIDKGVREILCELKSVQLDEHSGEISGVNICEASSFQNSIIAADLYIDCTGDKEFLIGKSLGVTYDSLEHYLPMDRQCYTTTNIQHAAEPYTIIRSAPSGFIKEVATQTHKQCVYSYHSNFITDNEASTFMNGASGGSSEEFCYLPALVGQRSSFWSKNCIAIGGSAGYVQEFTIDRLHLVQSAVLRLLTLFPATKKYELNSKEYNRLTTLEYQHIVDFHQLHYKSVKEMHTPFWEYVKNMTTTASLTHRLHSFSKRGILPFFEGETLSHGNWTSFLLGAHCWPVAYDPMVDKYDSQWIADQLLKMRTMMSDAAKTLPLHHEYLHNF